MSFLTIFLLSFVSGALTCKFDLFAGVFADVFAGVFSGVFSDVFSDVFLTCF